MNKLILKLRTFSALFLLAMRLDFGRGFDFFSQYLWILFLCIMYRYVFSAALLGREIPLGNYHIGFPLFLISGLALLRLVMASLKLFEDTFAVFKKQDLVEWIKISPTGWWEILLSSAAWKMLVMFSEISVMVIAAHYFIGTPAKAFLQTRIIVTAFLTVLTYAGLGLTVSGIIRFFKRGAFLFPLIYQTSFAFGGVYFPAHLLPKQLHFLINGIPIASALAIIRSCLAGNPAQAETFPLGFLAFSAFASLFAGAFFLNAAIRWSQKHGTL